MEAGRRLALGVGTAQLDILWLKSLLSLITYQLSELSGLVHNSVVTRSASKAFFWSLFFFWIKKKKHRKLV